MIKQISFLCSRYASRPEHCQSYPWENAQILFADCQFVVENGLVSKELLVLERGEKFIQEYCERCGKCCFAWSQGEVEITPVAKCSALLVGGCVRGASRTTKQMLKITQVIDFF